MKNLRIVPAAEFRIAELADLLTRGFASYFVPIRQTTETFTATVRREGLDLLLSRVALLDEQPVAIALVAVRGWTSRLAAMGVVEDVRGKGVGRVLCQAVVDAAKESGSRRMRLEVITANTRALSLYESLGFEKRRRLVGFEQQDDAMRPAEDPPLPSGLVEIDPLEAARQVASFTETELPWQLAPENALGWSPPVRAFRARDAEVWAQISSPDAEAISIYSLVAAPDQRRRGNARCLVEDLRLAFPGRRWKVSAIVPEGYVDTFFERCGFSLMELSQFEMDISLEP